VIAVKYLLIIHNNPAFLDALSSDELDELMAAHGPFQEQLRESGELVGFAALADPSQSRTVRVRDGVPAVTDGPFLEAKEHLAGYYEVDCASIERAVELAGLMPEARYQGVEVRPVLGPGGDEM
jgi:hypothetical protein